MLILTRRVGESLRIGDNIRIHILPNPNSNSRQIRVGIEAPKDVKILRSEIVGNDESRGNRR